MHAIVDSTIIPCAAEDGPGHLYFCLPRNVTNFKIVGRSINNASVGFSGEYNVTISKEIVTTNEATPLDQPAIDETQMPSDEMPPESEPDMSDKKPEMSDDEPDMSKPEMSKPEMSKPEMSKPEAQMMESK